MGVNHGGGEEDESPEFGMGNANANFPPDFVMFQNFAHQIACITMKQCSKKHISPIILTVY